ncbi:DUF1080 domain-containing protein [Galbibacter sp. EGI 63066]|uniref:family 16 glycoside hydrolase n=1 Tax=Galbibacter sp. EGI 63066 TaxID=2993559 RepID=UPI0022495432|nr:family 16 glycoside hydrolase [Galbibacter sp. EGI 63066]MCX2681758.1 DUF1080 domain-containing protein [Galbibacter sp. EGI 63066]
MKQYLIFIPLTLFSFLSVKLTGQQTQALNNPNDWEVYNRKVSFNKDIIHLDSGRGNGILWLKDSEFCNGTIDLEIKGNNTQGASFVGVVINGKNNDIYDAIYFRPFNFKNPQKQQHMVQYIAMPHLNWKRLREVYPNKYENKLTPTPDPDNWFHVRLVINYPTVKVFVNNSTKSSLTVEQINLSGHGKIGLWVGENSEGWFKNVSVKKDTMNRPSRILMDVGHDQVFWNDPKSMDINNEKINRVYMMSGELMKTIKPINVQVDYSYGLLDENVLEEKDILFIHVPKKQYTTNEIQSIHNFLNNGGSMFMVMDSDYWSSLDDTNVNAIIAPYGIQYGDAIPDTLSGGHTVKGEINDDVLKISYHEARKVNGGIPFCYGDELGKAYPFGVYATTKGGGKLVVMGEAMVSLYMDSWKGVNDYQCQAFMQDVINWLK